MIFIHSNRFNHRDIYEKKIEKPLAKMQTATLY